LGTAFGGGFRNHSTLKGKSPENPSFGELHRLGVGSEVSI